MVVAPRRVALLLTMLCACSFGGSIGPGYRCGEGDTCPDGQSCSAGFCTVAAAEIDGGGSEIDGGEAAARCGTISLLQDDFASGFGDRWFPWDDPPGATMSSSAGAAVVTFAAGSEDRWAGIDSSALFELRGGELDVEVAQVGGINTVVEIRGANDEKAQMVIDAGLLTAAVYDTPGQGARNAIPYVPADHRYWRLRGDEDTLYWEYSADRVEWTVLHSEAFPFAPEHVKAVLAAGGQIATASAARFADVNGATTADLGYCPAAELVEDFASGALEPVWDHWNDAGCTIAPSAGALTMDFDPGTGDSWCGISSRHLFDITASTYVVDAAGAPGASQFVTNMAVVDPGDNETFAEIQRDDDMLYVRQSVNGTTFDAVSFTYQAGSHRFWRLRGAGGRIYFESSGDGNAWLPLSDAPSRLDLSRVRLVVGAGHYGAGPGSPQTVTINAVNP
jgi:hypothetical protein